MEAASQATQNLESQADFEQRVRSFSEFLHDRREEWEKKIDSQLANGQYRIPLELSDLKKMGEKQFNDGTLDAKVLANPIKYLPAWEEALLSFLREINERSFKTMKQPLKLDIQGSFGRNHVTPRGMTANTLHRLMKVEGIVIKAGVSAPKLLQSMHVKKHMEDERVHQRDHRDATAFVNSPMAGAMPNKDSDGNDLMIEIGLSVYKDFQKFNIQEAPENAPPGQIPRSVEVICEGDLVDKAKPGERVQVVGVYKPFPGNVQDTTNGVFPARIIATSITPVKEMLEDPFVSQDIGHIRDIAARDDAFQLLARSFAPSICGHEKIKEGLLLQMIGGTEKNRSNGMHLRGDINVLLVGDPSCGKSQMLRFVMNTAPLAISTTGRGSSGVGLTAAMIREPGSRDFILEAGAMVLADRGFICIDEFDKMAMNDRVALHEAMEQQVVTIAKAGMHVTLNARCSVVAAANPQYGNFDPSMTLAKNIGLPDSLLSRFDLVFIVRDLTTEEIDRKIATQVLRQASMREGAEGKRGVESVHCSILERRQEQAARSATEPTPVFQSLPPGPDGEPAPEVLTVDFLRKFLRFCRRMTPRLSEEAQAVVADKYVDMRMRFQSGFMDQNNPDSNRKPRLAVTTRTLEAIIRLATAHAKLKLRKDKVLAEDVEVAYKLMLAAREEDEPEAPAEAPVVIDGDDNDQDGGAGAIPSQRRGKKRRAEAAEAEASDVAGPLTEGRLSQLTTLVAAVFARTGGAEEILQSDLLDRVNAGLSAGEHPFSEDEFARGLQALEDRNKVMVVAESGTVIHVS